MLSVAAQLAEMFSDVKIIMENVADGKIPAGLWSCCDKKETFDYV